MRVVGTAGHVDHGKSTLIAALTGVHPDRLKEEQEREMTIDLGFGWLALPDGSQVGIVDVPGHRDFIENMLAGVGGIDAALLVIAADEGIMPQTREHLAILDLLQVPAGLIVLTKTDLVDDPEWLDLVEADVRNLLRGTLLAEAPCLRVSARTRTGLDELIVALAALLEGTADRPDLGRPRLPIDRVFSMPGFGTVVTGTLSDGRLAVGEEVEMLPSGQRARIRGLQTHKQKEDTALPGGRTAVNLSGLDTSQVRRGEVVAHPGQYQPTRRLDAHLRLLPGLSGPLRNAAEVKLFLGTAEIIATIRLLEADALNAGQEGWAQLELRDPLVAVRGDRFILRRPSPGETLGGGTVVDPQPRGRHKRRDPAMLERLAALSQGTPADVLLQAALALGPASLREMVKRARLDLAAAQSALGELLAAGTLLLLEDGPPDPASDVLAAATGHWSALREQTLKTAADYHGQFPLRRGMPREELKSRLKTAARPFNALLRRLTAAGELEETGPLVRLPGHEIRFSEAQQRRGDALLGRFQAAPYTPPSVKECQTEAGEDVYQALLDLGRLTSVSSEVVFRKEDHDAMVTRIREHLQKNGTITVAEVRDLFDTSRKYALALMENLDATGVTARDGDLRRLRSP